MGMTLRQIIYGIGGGIPGRSASRRSRQEALRRLYSETLLDLPVDFDRLQEAVP